MKATIDYYGGWFRWRFDMGRCKYAEGKCGTFTGASEMCYAIVAIFNRGEIKPLTPKPRYATLWETLEWIETPKALEMAARDIERDTRMLINVKRRAQ